MDYRSEFGDFEGVTYLDAAGQGPLPLKSVRAAQAALEQKKMPHRIPDAEYFGLPDRIRGLLARLMKGDADEFAITSGASSGMAVVASNVDWKPDDEVLIGRGEFPAHFSTFMPLADAGRLRVKIVTPRERFLRTSDYIEHFTPKTRLVSVSMVRFDDGSLIDADRLAQACRKANVMLLLDMSQCACAIPIDLRTLDADFAVSSGYKWLLSPYGTGFFWANKNSMKKLCPGPVYWKALEGARNFHSLNMTKITAVPGASRWDAPETAAFTNLAAMQASLEFVERVGIEAIAEHNKRLVAQLVERLPRDACVLASPSAPENRGSYICVAARKPERTKEFYERLRSAQVIVSLREGSLRIAPYLYNTERDIAKLISILST
ncbi:MAG TPA: aminotransferase class V-fold PLP-dependent enzyme [Candidatus Acidoferrales bacterium]|nr:aminotransferase class V-fold PLP-dependent enzyme [Candidatus Acidoferrales bacterium]